MNTQEKRIFSLGLLLVIGLSLFLAQTTLGARVDRVLRDQITDTHIRNEAVVVGIDDASLRALGAWPWERSTFARALDTLYKNGARLIVFDILFLEERAGDSQVRSVLTDTKEPVIFASKLDKNNLILQSVYSNTPYALNGIAHVYPDIDGKVRTVPLYQKDATGKCYESLAYKAFLVYSKQEAGVCTTTPLPFLFQETPPDTLSLIDVINNKVPQEKVNGKVIFIGSNSLDIEDHFVGQNGEKIPGVYVHASIFTTLLNSSFLQPVAIGGYIFLLLLLLSYGLFTALRLHNVITQGVLILFGTFFTIAVTLIGMSLHYEVSLSLILFPYILVSVYGLMFRYTLTEKKNSYIKELFGQYVHPKVLANILKNNDLKLGGEKKYITILFSDIRGFTTMTEKMQPEELVDMLNTYLETMSPIIMKNEGVIDKYIGDAIMAFWNAPVEVIHHEEKAVRTSLHMIAALKRLNKETPLAIGIGLHAGEVIVGNIGSKARINYTIIGDAVNACSRLEGLTKKYGLQIIVSEQIKNGVTTDDIIWRSIDSVRVKGKSEVMKLYEPLENTPENLWKVKASQEAFTFYTLGKFTEARAIYKSVDDTYSAKMITRIEALIEQPPLIWTGTWDWDEK